MAGTQRTRTLVLALSIMLAVAACGDDGGDGSDAASDEENRELETLLLDASDFPSGWSEASVPESERRGLCGEPSPLDEVPPVALAEAVFAEDPDLGPLLLERLVRLTRGGADEVLELTRSASESCSAWDDAELGETSIGELSFASLGDESLAVRLGAESGTADFVLIRIDDLLIQLTAVGLNATDLEEYAVLALEKAAPDSGSTGATDEGATTETEASAEGGPSFLVGTAAPRPPNGPDGEVAVVASGPPDLDSGSVPVIVRNNESAAVTSIEVAATGRDPAGSIVGGGESQGLEPAVVRPGEIAIGYVFFSSPLPSDATFEFDVEAEEAEGGGDDYFAGVEIVEHNKVEEDQGGFVSGSIVGTVRNVLDVPVTGPISVLVMCFGDAGDPLYTSSGFAASDALEHGETSPFSVQFFETPCPTYLVGASGFNESAL